MSQTTREGLNAAAEAIKMDMYNIILSTVPNYRSVSCRLVGRWGVFVTAGMSDPPVTCMKHNAIHSNRAPGASC